MKAQILEIKEQDSESTIITVKVYWRGLPRPDYQGKETDEQYAERVKLIADEIDSYNNLHIGWANLTQELDLIKIPKVDEYDS